MEVFDKAMEVIRSPYYRKLDPSIPWDKFEYAMHMDRMTLLAYLRDFKDPEIAEKVLESAEYIHREQAKNQTDDERLAELAAGLFLRGGPLPRRALPGPRGSGRAAGGH